MSAIIAVIVKSGTATIRVPVDKGATIAQLKQKIKTRITNEQLPPKINLYMGDAELFDEDTVVECGIENETILTLYNVPVASVPSAVSTLVPGAQSNVLEITYRTLTEIKKILASRSTTIKTLSEDITKNEGLFEKGFVSQLFTTEMPIFVDDTTEQITLGDLDISDQTFLYVHFIPLTLWDGKYAACKTVDEITRHGCYWSPPVEQTGFSVSTFLCCLNSLRVKCSEHPLESTQFLFALEKILYEYRPALLAMRRYFDGHMFSFEKHVLVSSFYRVMRQLLPASVADKDVLSCTPQFFVYIIEEQSSMPEEISLFYEEKEINVLKTNPHKIMSCMIKVLTNVQLGWNFITWTSKTISRHIKPHAAWSSTNFQKIRQNLCQKERFAHVCYLQHSQLTAKFRGLSVDKDGYCVHVLGKEKTETEKKSFNVFHPHQEVSSMPKDKFISDDDFSKLALPYPMHVTDTRPIVQVNLVLFDHSGSMADKFEEKSGSVLSRQEVAKILFGALCDKISSAYRYPHAIGLLAFASEITPLLPISKDFDNFEKALATRTLPVGTTNLFPSFSEAEKMLDTYTANNNSLGKTVVNRLLCLTDGEDTSAIKNLHEIAASLQKKNIIVDAVAIGGASHGRLCSMCYATGGIFFKIDNVAEGLKLFESEGFLSLENRELATGTPITTAAQFLQYGSRPALKFVACSAPTTIKSKAVLCSSASCRDLQKSTPNAAVGGPRRIFREFALCHASTQLSRFQIFMNADDYTLWKVILQGEIGTLYAEGYWLLYINFKTDYPNVPPEVRFVTPIYHCNINNDGKVCHEVLTTKWSPSTSIEYILVNLLDLLQLPNPMDALDSTKGQLLLDAPQEYEANVKLHVKQYAAHLQKIKEDYKLEL